MRFLARLDDELRGERGYRLRLVKACSGRAPAGACRTLLRTFDQLLLLLLPLHRTLQAPGTPAARPAPTCFSRTSSPLGSTRRPTGPTSVCASCNRRPGPGSPPRSACRQVGSCWAASAGALPSCRHTVMLYEPAFLFSTEFNVKSQRSPLHLMLQPEARLIPHRQPCRVTRASGEVAFGSINGYDPQDACDFYPTPIGPGGSGMGQLAARRTLQEGG